MRRAMRISWPKTLAIDPLGAALALWTLCVALWAPEVYLEGSEDRPFSAVVLSADFSDCPSAACRPQPNDSEKRGLESQSSPREAKGKPRITPMDTDADWNDPCDPCHPWFIISAQWPTLC